MLLPCLLLDDSQVKLPCTIEGIQAASLLRDSMVRLTITGTHPMQSTGVQRTRVARRVLLLQLPIQAKCLNCSTPNQ